MLDILINYYLYLKALHIISAIAWMAGLLYLPRLFVYHTSAQAGSELSKTLKIMEYRLLKYIMNPAMMATWLFALLMVYANTSLFQQGWFHAKFSLVILMSIAHMLFARWRKTFAADQNIRNDKFYRIWNEVPTMLMILIVILAVAKPF